MLLTLMALAAGAAPFRPAPPLDRADLERWLDGLVPAALHQAQIAGAVIVVVKDGQILFEKGYGLANLATRAPMDPDRSVIGVGSVSKTFTWTAVMQLVEAGKLDLDRDVNGYLERPIPATFPQPITLRHLLTHTAGFAERTFKNAPAGEKARGVGDYIRGTPYPERIRAPGLVPAYSNYGSMLAGYIIERASGELFVDYLDRHILGPLGMTHSSFRRPIPPTLEAMRAPSYRLVGEAADDEPNEEPAGDPSGHLVTTAGDVGRFMIAHLEGGALADARILRPETVTLMHTPTFRSFPGVPGTALGLFRLDRNGHAVLWHGGDISDYRVALHLLPDDRVGFFIGMNSSGVSHGAFSESNAVRTAVFNRFMDRYFPAPAEPEAPTAPTALAHARLAAGEYTMSQQPGANYLSALFLLTRRALDLSIKANPDGTIETPGSISFETQQPQRWRETEPFVWKEIGGPAELRMRVDDGRVTAFWPNDLPAIWLIERVPFAKSLALNLPLFVGAVLILGLGALVVAVTAFRRNRAAELPAPERRARAITRWAPVVAVAALVGWGAVVATSLSDRLGAEPWIRLVQVVNLAAVGLGLLAIWAAWVTLRGRTSAVAKLASVLVAGAMAELIWFSFAFHLISARLNY